MYGDFTKRFLQLAVAAVVAFVVTVCIGIYATANDYDIVSHNRYDVITAHAKAVRPVVPAPPPVTVVTAEVADRWFPAPASDEQYTKLRAGVGVASSVTRSRTVTRNYASAGTGYARAQPVRRVLGLFRGRLGCAMGGCAY